MATTGSTMTLCVMGQKNSTGILCSSSGWVSHLRRSPRSSFRSLKRCAEFPVNRRIRKFEFQVLESVIPLKLMMSYLITVDPKMRVENSSRRDVI